MQKYISKIDAEFLKEINTNYIYTPTMYFHNNPAVRWLFWERLNVISKFIQMNQNMRKKTCIDFGGGSGVFLPTLCNLFEEVILIDLEPSQAEIIKKEYQLDNCTIIKDDVFDLEFDNIDCIIAADVIEHFSNTKEILDKLKTFMGEKTYMITSLPTENWFYVFLRLLFKQEKPIYHYFSSYEIEKVFINEGFLEDKKSKFIPLPKPFDLFSIKQWSLS